MTAADATTVAEFILAGGVATVLAELVRKFTGRKRDRVDAAAVVQEAALELLGPIRAELREARREAVDARREAGEARVQLARLRDEMDQVIVWAQMAKRELNSRGISIAPIPIRRTNGA